MLYKTISSKTVIQRVMSRFALKDANLTYDAIEWIGSCIGLIGTHVGYQNRIEEVEVDFHKIHLPENFYQLNFVTYNGKKLKDGKISPFRQQTYTNVDNPLVVELVQALAIKHDLIESIENTDCCDNEQGEDLMIKQGFLNKRIAGLYDAVKDSPQYCDEHWYTDGENCYDTSIEEGCVYICYKAYPLDGEGFPLIVDEEKYLQALEWYVLRCWMEQGNRHKVMDYAYVSVKSDQWIAKAKNEHLKMSYEQMDQFTSNWTNMLYQLRENNPNYYSN